MRQQDGQALLMVVVVMLILQMFAGVFLARVSFEQRLAGGSTRSLAALYLAEAGLQKALWVLEEGKDLTLPYQEALGVGTFAIEALEHLPGGLISVVVRGDAANVRRRLRVLARAGPPALAYGVYGQHSLRFDGRARTYLLPFRAGGGDCRCAGNLAASGEVRFESPHVLLNTFHGSRLPLRDGTIDDYALLGSSAVVDPAQGLVDLVLAGGARLTSGIAHKPIELEELRRYVGELGIRRLKVRPALQGPSFEVDQYRALAEANTANTLLNRAAAEAGGAAGLRVKPHSRYIAEEFETVLDYLKGGPRRALQGVVFVEGDVDLVEGDKLIIADGALVVEGDIVIGPGARLEVHHGPTARTLPGVVAWGKAAIDIEEEAVAVVDGLVLTDGDVVVFAGILDVIGAVTARNFVTKNGTVVVRYDAAVLATPGFQKIGKGLAVPVSWQELQ
ncbi:MAG: pilus assembly PilX family protein [Armatimonadota bacterium]